MYNYNELYRFGSFSILLMTPEKFLWPTVRLSITGNDEGRTGRDNTRRKWALGHWPIIFVLICLPVDRRWFRIRLG